MSTTPAHPLLFLSLKQCQQFTPTPSFNSYCKVKQQVTSRTARSLSIVGHWSNGARCFNFWKRSSFCCSSVKMKKEKKCQGGWTLVHKPQINVAFWGVWKCSLRCYNLVMYSVSSLLFSLSGVFLKASIILMDIPHQKKEKKNIMLFTLNIHTAKTF